MKRCLYPFLPILLGLVIAQVIGTVQVYLSNVELHHNLTVMKNEGYLLVPNQNVMATLRGLGPAFFGGLFFTLSVGAGLSLLSLCAAWVYDRLMLRSRIVLLSFIILWVCLLVVINWKGLSVTNTAYFLLIPPVVFVPSLRRHQPDRRGREWISPMAGICSVAALGILWSGQMDRHLFSDIRDYLLLSNPVGTRVNDFYYRYTLYPAEVFKSLDQKLLKSCRLKLSETNSQNQEIEKKLMFRDYLPVETSGSVDLIIQQDGDSLIFKQEEKSLRKVAAEEFLAKPGSMLHGLSAKTDRSAFFRQFTFLSLLIAFPLVLYIFAYSLCCVVAATFISYRSASILSIIICFLAGISIFFYFDRSRSVAIEKQEVWNALASECWQTRVAALKLVEEKRLDVTKFQEYRKLLSSPLISERVWAVKALGVSRESKSFNHLVSLLGDPNPNVASAVFSELGSRGDIRAVPIIIKKIKSSHHWYNQWHAYKALKALGWRQSKSN